MADLDAIFKAYDIRGTTPDQFDAPTARSIGAAFARLIAAEDGSDTVIVARDMRPTGVEFVAAFTDGVTAQGLHVIDVGLASTDLMYFASGSRDLPGAVFTASHNPAGYNGIKMCLSSAKPIGEETGLQSMKADVAAGTPDATGIEPGTRTEEDLLGAFADHVRSFIDTSNLKPLKVIADTANGMGGLVVPAVFDGLPIDLEIMYEELDGTFPNHPADPLTLANLADLRARVLETGADVGLAFDGDADRVFLIDDQGEPLSGSITTAIVAKGVLDKEPGSTILHNLICSKTVREVVEENGGTAVKTRVGHSFIKAEMARTGAAFGGEHSAHYYFRENWRADSGSIAALVVLEQLSVADVPLSELRKPYDRYAASGEINTTVDDQQAVIERVSAAFPDAEQDRMDGLTVDVGDWWFNLRPSNTEPLLRLNLEAHTRAECDAKVAQVQDLMGA